MHLFGPLHKKPSSAQLDLWADDEDEHVWQKRFYDFNMWSERKHLKKLRYLHYNPVKRGS
jgi:putative transposase